MKSIWGATFFVIQLAIGAQAMAISTTITWDRIAGYDHNTLMLEITKDAFFTESLTKISLPLSSTYTFQAPAEGVYHYRIFQIGSNQGVRYGSFVALEAGKSTDVVQMDWATIEGQTIYTVKISGQGIETAYLRAEGNRYLLRRRPVPVMAEIFPEHISDHMAAQPTRNQALMLQLFPLTQLTVDKTPTESPKQESDEPSLPKWFMFAGASVQKEITEVKRVEISRQTDSTASGLDFGLRGHPLKPLIFEFRGGLSHSSEALAPTAQSEESKSPVVINEDHTYADMLLGIDALGFGSSNPHSIGLKLGGAFREIPHLLLEDTDTPRNELVAHRFALYGGGLDYTYHTEAGRFFVGATSFANYNEHALARKANVGFGVLMGRSADLTIEAFYSLTAAETCNVPNSLCFITNTASVEKSGTIVGIGTSL